MRGVLWLGASWLLSGVWVVLAKYMTDRLGATWAFVFSNGMFIPPLVWLVVRTPIPSDKLGIVLGVATGVSGVVGMYTYFKALEVLPGSIVNVVNQMHVIFAVLVFLLFGEKLTLRQGVGVVLGFVASFLILGGGVEGGVDGRSAKVEQVVRDGVGRSQGQRTEGAEQVRTR